MFCHLSREATSSVTLIHMSDYASILGELDVREINLGNTLSPSAPLSYLVGFHDLVHITGCCDADVLCSVFVPLLPEETKEIAVVDNRKLEFRPHDLVVIVALKELCLKSIGVLSVCNCDKISLLAPSTKLWRELLVQLIENDAYGAIIW